MAEFLSSKKPVIAVDLDEVLGDFVPAIAEWHNNTYGTKLLPSHFFSYAFKDVWGGTDAESVEKVHQFFETDYFKNMKPIKMRGKSLLALKKSLSLSSLLRQHTIADETRRWLASTTTIFLRRSISATIGQRMHQTLTLPAKKKPANQTCASVNALAIIDDSTKYAYQCAPILKKYFVR